MPNLSRIAEFAKFPTIPAPFRSFDAAADFQKILDVHL
jgi:hypothetical protein